MAVAKRDEMLAAIDEDGKINKAVFGNALSELLVINNAAQVAEYTKILEAAQVPKTTSRLDAWESVGGRRDADAMNMRIMALTNPEGYQALRDEAVRAIKIAVEAAFNSSYNQFKDAGYSMQDAETEALKAAQVVKDSQYRAMHSRFGDDSLFLKGTAHSSDAFKVPR